MNRSTSIVSFIAITIFLILIFARITYISPEFEYGSHMLARPIMEFIGWMMLAGLLYFCAIWFSRHSLPDTRISFCAILLVGLVLRGIVFISQPILEDDYYRYLWEGGVTANGYNPYVYVPNDVFWVDEDDIPSDLIRLAHDSGQVAERVNHPSLGTVYPPVTQAAFGLAHALRPWSLDAWKLVLFICDAATLLVLVGILKQAGLPRAQVIIYWWNPILIKETYNSAHMDAVIMVFLVLGLYFIVKQQLYRSGTAFALAVGAKLWPLLVLPIVLRASTAGKRTLAKAVAVSGAVLLLVCSPMLWAIPLGDRSGFVAYGEQWEMNDALFMVVAKGVRILAEPFGLFEANIESLTRWTVAGMLLGWVLVLLRKPIGDSSDLFNRLVLAIGALFMLSPTQYPWYFLWLLPLLTLSPRPSLLLLTLMLPVYYLKFYYSALGEIDTFHNVVVWMEYAPVLLVGAYELYRYRLAPVSKKEVRHA